jgi:hypothetical protein
MQDIEYINHLSRKYNWLERQAEVELGTSKFKTGFSFFEENRLKGGDCDLVDEKHKFNKVIKGHVKCKPE